MEDKVYQNLKIDKEFKNLIPPLSRSEYLQLEENILAEGCREPIITWNGYIIDGHNRYEICTKHSIKFSIKEKEFDYREDAIAWICANQLGRRNVTEETRKFLIGMQYENEKVAAKFRNARGTNQYSGVSEKDIASGRYTSKRIAEQQHISHGTVQKYAEYTRALEAIGKKDPDLVPKILSGRYKISHNNIVALSRLSPQELKSVIRRIEQVQQPFIQYSTARKEILSPSLPSQVAGEQVAVPSVKDAPVFDPDAELIGLTLTIPSWGSSIERAMSNADLSLASKSAKYKLIDALTYLRLKIDDVLSAIKEE
ncbi:MAG: hypothetical protein ACI3W5_08215 [Faecousia sp.]